MPALPDVPEAESKTAASARLDRSLASGIAWTGGMRGVTQGVQWLAALLVVRLLTPADYGLVGMAGVYLGLVRMLSEFGLGAAIIQHRYLTREQIARLGGVSVAFAVMFALLSIGAAKLIAAFFGEPAVEDIILVLSLTFVFSGIDVLPRSLLKRDLQFKRLAWVQASENLSYAVSVLTLAALGFGYWSLVLGALIGTLVRMVVAMAVRWHPIAMPRELHTIRAELLFGWHIVASRLAIYVRGFAHIAIVGKVLGTVALGAYNVAWMQANIAVDRVTALASEVTPSIFAAAQNDKAALRRYLRIVTEGIAFISFPATIGMALLADHFVLLVFGDHWSAAIMPLRLLALVGALRAITPILSQVLIATDQARLNMRFTVASAIVIPIFVLIGTRWGLTGAAVGWLVGQPLTMLPILLPQALEAVDMRMRDYLRAVWPAALACAVMAGAIVATRLLLPAEWPLALRFVIEVLVGVAVYGAGVFTSYRSRLATFFALVRAGRGKAPLAEATP